MTRAGWIAVALVVALLASNAGWAAGYARLARRDAALAYHDLRTEAELDRAMAYIHGGQQ